MAAEDWGKWGDGSWQLEGAKRLSEVMKCSKLAVVLVTQLREHATDHRTELFEWVHCAGSKLPRASIKGKSTQKSTKVGTEGEEIKKYLP